MKNTLQSTLRLTMLSAAMALALAGCSSGGSDSATGNRSVAGTASKGTIKGGAVAIYAIDAVGNKGAAPIATSTTLADGTFTASIPESVTTFVVEVSFAAGATIADEANNADIPMPTTLVMRTVATVAAGAGNYTGSVTPLTELAVKTAEKAGGLTTANIAKAKNDIRAALGFDPETVVPVNANSDAAASASDTQQYQALILAALSKIAKDGGLGCSAADLACVVNAFADAAQTAADGTLTFGTVGQNLETALDAVAADPVVNKTPKKLVDLPPATKEPGVPTIPTTPPAAETGVESAKKLFTSLRNNFNAIKDQKPALLAQADTVKADFTSLRQIATNEIGNWLAVPVRALDHYALYKAGSVPFPYSEGPQDAYCEVQDASGEVANTSQEATQLTCSFNRQEVYFKPGENGSSESRHVFDVVTITPGNGVHAYTTKKLMSTYFEAPNPGQSAYTETELSSAHANSGTITYAPNSILGGDRFNFILRGSLGAIIDDNFTGASGQSLSAHRAIDMTLTRERCDCETLSYNLQGSLSTFKDSIKTGELTVLPTSKLVGLDEIVPGEIHRSGITNLTMAVVGGAGSSRIDGTIALSNWVANKRGKSHIPSYVVFTGEIKRHGVSLFSGGITYNNTGFHLYDPLLPDSANNFLSEKVTVRGNLAIPQRNPLAVTVTATAESFAKTTVTAQYKDGTNVVNVSGAAVRDANGLVNHSLALSSATGVSVTITDADRAKTNPTVDVKKDSEVVAVIELDTGVVRYKDATFDSLR